ncbi:helix-turn-helix transcriptional regulator [Salinarimonas ramus]|nr:helix-turn-helix transcriptional regulator [Salinarimonas ramus]
MAGSEGAILLPMGVAPGDVPFSPGLADLARVFFEEGWCLRDLRARGAPLTRLGQVVSDENVATEDEIARSDYYNDFVRANGFGWFCAVGFRAGASWWGLSFQRTMGQGRFEEADKRAVGALRAQMTQAATLSELVGRRALAGTLDGLALIGKAVFALDFRGVVVARNEAADALLGRDLLVRGRRLQPADERARVQLDEAIAGAARRPLDLGTGAPILLRDASGLPALALRLASVPPSLAQPFLGARLLCLATPVDAPRASTSAGGLADAFGLTPAEARLCTLLGHHRDLRETASRAGISYETARNHLKRVYAKTGTGRQADLLELMTRLTDV